MSDIERLRVLRQRPQRDFSIEQVIRQTADAARKNQKKLGNIIDLWEQLVPPDLAVRTRIQSMNRGTLNVSVDSSATAYDLDRLLREGLEHELRSRYGGTLSRVRLRVSGEDSVVE